MSRENGDDYFAENKRSHKCLVLWKWKKNRYKLHQQQQQYSLKKIIYEDGLKIVFRNILMMFDI